MGCRLVPEHVETRPLLNPDKPGIEQVMRTRLGSGVRDPQPGIIRVETGLVRSPVSPLYSHTPPHQGQFEWRVCVLRIPSGSWLPEKLSLAIGDIIGHPMACSFG